MSARITMSAFIVALLALFGVVCGLTPLLSDDWDHVVWATQHRHDRAWLWSFLQTHETFSGAITYVLARSRVAHAILTPLVGLALVWGTFVLAMRRRPRFDEWSDVIGVVLIAALIWIAAPRTALVYFHRPFSGTWLYGTTLAVWFLVPLRCNLRLRAPLIALLVLAGFLVATSTRQLGVFTAFAVLYAIKQTPQRRWLWVALVAVLAGTVVGYLDRPFDFRGFRPGIELSMVAMNLAVYECGELISFVGALVLVKLVVGKLWPHHAGDPVPETGETLRFVGAWFGYCVLALFGPRYSEATLFPAAILLVVAALPYVLWVMTSRPMKIAVLAIGIAINVIAWSMALATYVPLHAEYKDRITKLRAAPKGSVATVTTYSQIRPTFWAYGEDWGEAARRELVATQVYRLRDIEIVPPFRRLEMRPTLDIRLEVDGVTPEQLRAADAPDVWATTPRAARAQFSGLVDRLRRHVTTPFAARIIVALSYPVLKGRKLLVASYEDGALTIVRIIRRQADEGSRIPIVVSPKSFTAKYLETYALSGERSTPITYERGRAYYVQALTTELHAIVACDPQRCFLVDAFIPAF